MSGDVGIGSFVFLYILKGHTNEIDFRCFDVNCWSLSIWKLKTFQQLCKVPMPNPFKPISVVCPFKGEVQR
jgi:hypothetical protein